MASPITIRSATRLSGWIALVSTVAYLFLAVLPFYGNGIHLHSYQEIGGSLVDVKGYPPFSWLGWAWFGGPLQGAALLAAGFGPLASLLFAPLLAVLLWAGRRSLRRREIALWATICLACVAILVLTWQMRGIILTWLAD